MTENRDRAQHSSIGSESLGDAIAPTFSAPSPRNNITPPISHFSRPTAAGAPAVNFYINHLVLHGFSAVDRHRVGAAMQAELTRLFAEEGVPLSLRRGGAIDQLNAGEFEMAPGLPPRVVGIRIARSIYRGLGYE